MTKATAEMRYNPNKAPLLLLSALLLLIACNNTLHHSFISTGCNWDRNDTLTFTYTDSKRGCDSLLAAGVELRCTSDYPYKDLWLRIESYCKQSNHRNIDTLHCTIYDNNGRMCGTTAGLMYQISYPAGTMHYTNGDTLIIHIMHIMEQEVLKGVSDVGLILSRCDQHQSSKN